LFSQELCSLRIFLALDFDIELHGMFRVERVWAYCCRWSVSPMLVGPQPIFGMRTDNWFKLIPAGLCNLVIGSVGREPKLREKAYLIASISSG
jgi:hypothetical protein